MNYRNKFIDLIICLTLLGVVIFLCSCKKETTLQTQSVNGSVEVTLNAEGADYYYAVKKNVMQPLPSFMATPGDTIMAFAKGSGLVVLSFTQNGITKSKSGVQELTLWYIVY